MKNYIQALFLFLMLTQFCFAQPVSPSASQGGWFWQNPLPTGNGLWGVSFTDANNGTAVGDAGTVLRTTDGGQNWIIQTSGAITWLGRVSFTDANNGRAVGYDDFTNLGIILGTTDGGQHWINQPSGTSSSLEGVSFTNANTEQLWVKMEQS